MIPGQSFLSETLDWLIGVNDTDTVSLIIRKVLDQSRFARPQALDFCAEYLFKAKKYAESAILMEKFLAQAPWNPAAKHNYARCLARLDRLEEAEAAMRDVVKTLPHSTDAHLDLALYISLQGRHAEARDYYLKLKTIVAPGTRDDFAIDFNLASYRLLEKDFKGGMALLTRGRPIGAWGNRSHQFPKPLLTAETPLKGKTVLISGECGIGDEIINARFGRIIQSRGGRSVWLSGFPSLVPVLRRTEGLDEVITSGELAGTHYDYWVPSMDLAHILDIDVTGIPSHPYIAPNPEFVRKWNPEIRSRAGKLKIGIRWRGNARYEHDLMRSVPFALFEECLVSPETELISLQRDDGIEERPPHSRVMDLGSRLESWEDTAGAIANLDLVISSCTSVAHLAAAMGKPTWVLCPLSCYYIWSWPGSSSPWYPTVKIFRQARRRSWREPMEEAAKNLVINFRP